MPFTLNVKLRNYNSLPFISQLTIVKKSHLTRFSLSFYLYCYIDPLGDTYSIAILVYTFKL